MKEERKTDTGIEREKIVYSQACMQFSPLMENDYGSFCSSAPS